MGVPRRRSTLRWERSGARKPYLYLGPAATATDPPRIISPASFGGGTFLHFCRRFAGKQEEHFFCKRRANGSALARARVKHGSPCRPERYPRSSAQEA